MTPSEVVRLREAFDGPHLRVNTSDGKTLFVRRWAGTRPDSPVSVLILHGITAYSGPYGFLIANQLASAGFDLFGMDLRGHGLSDGARGDYPSGERLAKDLCETVASVRSESGKKLVVLGHSLGVLSAMIATNNCPASIDGLVLLSAGRKIRQGVYRSPGPLGALKALVGASILRGSPLIEYRRDGMKGIDDPLFNFNYSARFYSAVYGVGALKVASMNRRGVLDTPNLNPRAKLAIPLLVGVGSDDELFTVESAREFLDGIDGTDKELFVVPGGRHAFFPASSWGPLTDWLNRKFL